MKAKSEFSIRRVTQTVYFQSVKRILWVSVRILLSTPGIERGLIGELRRQGGHGFVFDFAVKNLRAFGLQDDRARGDRSRFGAVDPPRRVQAHHDLAVHDVEAVLAEADDLDSIPFSRRLFMVGLLHAAAVLSGNLRENVPFSAGI